MTTSTYPPLNEKMIHEAWERAVMIITQRNVEELAIQIESKSNAFKKMMLETKMNEKIAKDNSYEEKIYLTRIKSL